jgi:HNH endonuclease/NUMOD4 motif
MLHSDTEIESWLPVPGYEELYEISLIGRLRRKSASRMAPAGYVMKCRINIHGYPIYRLSKNRIYWSITAHRLVAIAFLGPPPFPGAQVAHFDGNKKNNSVSNLRWATQSENAADNKRLGVVCGAHRGAKHHLARLSIETVIRLRCYVEFGASIVDAPKAFGLHKITAYDAIVGKTWSHIPFPPPVSRRRK